MKDYGEWILHIQGKEFSRRDILSAIENLDRKEARWRQQSNAQQYRMLLKTALEEQGVSSFEECEKWGNGIPLLSLARVRQFLKSSLNWVAIQKIQDESEVLQVLAEERRRRSAY